MNIITCRLCIIAVATMYRIDSVRFQFVNTEIYSLPYPYYSAKVQVNPTSCPFQWTTRISKINGISFIASNQICCMDSQLK